MSSGGRGIIEEVAYFMEGQIAEDFNTMSCHRGQLTGISTHFFCFFFFLWTNIRYVKEGHKKLG